MYRIAHDVFVPANGYAACATVDGIALRDQVFLELDLERLAIDPAKYPSPDACDEADHESAPPSRQIDGDLRL